jgi:hypothetical protein
MADILGITWMIGQMTKGNPDWEKFEHEVQELLGLRSTPGSGNQWYDVGDGVSRVEDPYKLVVDCKHTSRSSFSLSGRDLNDWLDKADGLGYNFALPIHLDGPNVGRQRSWVASTLDDYAELVDSFRVLNGPKRCRSLPAMAHGKIDTTRPATYSCCRRQGHFGHHDNGTLEWSA